MSLTIEQYDDPLNPYGWALEPVRRRLEVGFPDADWRIHPSGMVESWDEYDGTEVTGGKNGMAAVCARVSETHAMPIDEYLWFDDPPTSSWPACRAVAAARPQGVDAQRSLLRACREATFLRRRPVSDDAVLADLFESADVDADRIRDALENGEAEERFAASRRAAADLDAPGVRRSGGRCELPTLVVRDGDAARAVSGVAPVEDVHRAIDEVAGRAPRDVDLAAAEVVERYSPEGWIARADLVALAGVDGDAAAEQVRELVESGEVVEETFAAESFWRSVDYVPTDGGSEGGDGDA